MGWVFGPSHPEAKFLNAQIRVRNLESSQAWGFCMDFLNQREGAMVFPPFYLQCTVTEL